MVPGLFGHQVRIMRTCQNERYLTYDSIIFQKIRKSLLKTNAASRTRNNDSMQMHLRHHQYSLANPSHVQYCPIHVRINSKLLLRLGV